MVHFLSPKSRKRKGRLPPLKKKLCAVRGPSLADLFIHLLVHLFIDITIPFCLFILSLGPPPQPQPSFIIAYIERRQSEIDLIVTLLCKVSNELANESNVSVDSLALHHFGPKQGGISWRNHPASKIWIVVYWKKVSRDCSTLYQVSNQFEYGLIALSGGKRSSVLFSHCASSEVAFIRLGMDMVNKRVLIMFLNVEDA